MSTTKAELLRKLAKVYEEEADKLYEDQWFYSAASLRRIAERMLKLATDGEEE